MGYIAATISLLYLFIALSLSLFLSLYIYNSLHMYLILYIYIYIYYMIPAKLNYVLNPSGQIHKKMTKSDQKVAKIKKNR